jgi:hypothetical protein
LRSAFNLLIISSFSWLCIVVTELTMLLSNFVSFKSSSSSSSSLNRFCVDESIRPYHFYVQTLRYRLNSARI